MATGRRLLEESMPHNYKQGCLYPTHYLETEEKPYGGTKKRNVRHVRKMGQSKVRKQLKKDLEKELENIEKINKNDLEWIDMETLEAHCYDCVLHDFENNCCKDISLCKDSKSTFKGFYKLKKK